MRIGIFDIMQVTTDVPSREAYAQHLAIAELADQLGYDYYFAAERHFMPLYRTPSPSVWLAAVAARTKRIRLGALAYTLPLHNPARLAEEISMLDHLSDGRMEVGVGLGHRPEELVSLGIDPRGRQGMLLEGLIFLRRAWRGEPFNHPGAAWRFQDLYVQAPVQQPHPPIWYAGNDPQAAAWAARNGLSLAVGFQPDERLAVPCGAYRTTLSQQESPPASARLALMRHLYLAESDERAYDEMASDIMRIGEVFAAAPRGAEAAGRPASRAEAEAAVERLRADDVIIAGGPETCAREIAATAARLGIDVLLINPFLTGVEPRRVRRTLRLCANRVLPLLGEAIAPA